ncbi:MAG TPA: methyltransferase domain-containing protein [Anaerolineales bacterium]|nr:methyltransferase domain-containing protein [Anaerolineales bacterium]
MAMPMDVNLPDKWQSDYERKTDGWDLGGPTPALKRLAMSGRFKPGRMAVPGAGRGHDAREFARRGFQVTAIDFAPHAVREMKRLADSQAPVEILQHDLFTLPGELDNSFDYLLEYTCFCAIDPRRRADYADVVRRLLKPGGTYIDMAFPLDGRAGGPPFRVSESEVMDLFTERGFDLITREKPQDSISPRKDAEELFIFQKR